MRSIVDGIKLVSLGGNRISTDHSTRTPPQHRFAERPRCGEEECRAGSFIDGLRPAGYHAMRALDRERPLLPPFSLIMRLTGLEVEAGQHLSSFLLHGGQLSGIETERRQDRRRDLVSLDVILPAKQRSLFSTLRVQRSDG